MWRRRCERDPLGLDDHPRPAPRHGLRFLRRARPHRHRVTRVTRAPDPGRDWASWEVFTFCSDCGRWLRAGGRPAVSRRRFDPRAAVAARRLRIVQATSAVGGASRRAQLKDRRRAAPSRRDQGERSLSRRDCLLPVRRIVAEGDHASPVSGVTTDRCTSRAKRPKSCSVFCASAPNSEWYMSLCSCSALTMLELSR